MFLLFLFFSSLIAVFFLNGRQSWLVLLTLWPASHFNPHLLKSLVVGRMSSGTDTWAMDHWKAKWNIKLLLCQELWICKWTPALLITEPREGKKEEESFETQNGLLKVKSPSFSLYLLIRVKVKNVAFFVVLRMKYVEMSGRNLVQWGMNGAGYGFLFWCYHQLTVWLWSCVLVLLCIKWSLEKYAVWFLMFHFIYIDSQGPRRALVTVPLLWQCHVDFNNLELSWTLTIETSLC